MELGVNLVYRGAGVLARAAEDLGYTIALAPEGYRSDAPSVLGYVAGRTDRIALASGVMQIPGRPPAMAALTAATLDHLSGGRFRLGLGVSNPDVANGWYGLPFDEPLGRTRAYVEIVRAALLGEPVVHSGPHYPLPLIGQPKAPLHLLTEGLRSDLPIYLAAVGPKSLQLAGEIADGWIGVFSTPEMVRAALANIAVGRARRQDASTFGFEVLPCLPTSVAEDLRDAADELRAHYVYLLGIGDPERNFYCSMAAEMGFDAAVLEIRDRLSEGDRVAAGAAVPLDFIDATSLIGSVGRIAGRMRTYASAGVTTLGIMVSAAAIPLDRQVRTIHQAAAALRMSAVDD